MLLLKMFVNVADASIAFPVISLICSTDEPWSWKTVWDMSWGRKNAQSAEEKVKPMNSARIKTAIDLCSFSSQASLFQFFSFFSSILIAPWTT